MDPVAARVDGDPGAPVGDEEVDAGPQQRARERLAGRHVRVEELAAVRACAVIVSATLRTNPIQTTTAAHTSTTIATAAGTAARCMIFARS